MTENEKYMRRAIELAKNGIGFTNPNPLVGAVIVKNGEIIGEGCHEHYGDLHAERNALKNCRERGNNPNGAELYVTLEPCCHHGKQPPCTEAVIAAGIKKVYVGSDDPNPLVAGKGINILRNAGIEVETRFLKEECDKLNDIFFYYITNKRPYCILKYAMSLDGKITTESGKSKWISNEKSREYTHFLRKRCAGIMVGIGTVLTDDPMLNCRIENPSNPVRIVLDSNLRIPIDSQLVKTAKEIPLFIATLSKDKEKINTLENAGVEIYSADEKDGKIDLEKLMKYLGEEKVIDSILIEGGSAVHSSAVKAGIVNELDIFVAPKIFGGKNAISPFSEVITDDPNELSGFKFKDIKKFDEDILLRYINKI